MTDNRTQDDVNLCKGCNTIKHLNTNGYCGRCVKDDAGGELTPAEELQDELQHQRWIEILMPAYKASGLGVEKMDDAITEIEAYAASERRKERERIGAGLPEKIDIQKKYGRIPELSTPSNGFTEKGWAGYQLDVWKNQSIDDVRAVIAEGGSREVEPAY